MMVEYRFGTYFKFTSEYTGETVPVILAAVDDDNKFALVCMHDGTHLDGIIEGDGLYVDFGVLQEHAWSGTLEEISIEDAVELLQEFC